MGYFLDEVHYEGLKLGGNEDVDGEEAGERFPAVYILPGAVVPTENMGEGTEGEWRKWAEER